MSVKAGALQVGSTTEHFVWSHTEPLPLLLADGKNDYIYGPGSVPLEQITGSTVIFIHHDQLGNTRLLTNTSGANVGSYNYDPYGHGDPHRQHHNASSVRWPVHRFRV